MNKFPFNEEIKPRVSYDKKIANDFQRQKDILDIYDKYYGGYRDDKELDRFDINYKLFNGNLDTSLYDDPLCLNLFGEKVKLNHQVINHYPIISQVANAMWGEIISRPFQPVAKDIGTISMTYRKKKWNELIKSILQAEIINPLQDEVMYMYMQQNGITDIHSEMSPEDMLQAQADIQRRVTEQTPDEILDFMENEFQTPSQRQAQQLFDYLSKTCDIKYKQQEGFKHAIITGKEIYFIGERHDEPVFELINPKYFSWGGSQNTEWIQEGHWAKNEQWLSFEECMQKHSEYFSKRDYKLLEDFAEPFGGFRYHGIGDPRKDKVQEAVMYELSTEDGRIRRKYDDVNIKSLDGQKRIKQLYADVIQKYRMNYGDSYSNYGIRESEIYFRDKGKLIKITREVDGKLVDFYRREYYEPSDKDIKVEEVWVDEIWGGTIIGTSDPIYTNIRRLPGQIRSIFNVYNTHLPYYGKSYNTHLNNAPNVSPIDLGKSFQLEFDTTMAQLKADMATDLGKIVTVLLTHKPETMSWTDFLNNMKVGKIMLLQPNKHGFQGVDPQFLKTLDLSRTSDIAGKIQLLESLRINLIRSMYFNPERMGSIGQYATQTNTQINQAASYNQTEGFFETHRLIVEKALNAFMNVAKRLYKDKPHKTSHILDDPARIDLEHSSHFWYEEIAIQFSVSTEDIRRMEELRARSLELIQNGLGFEGIVGLIFAKTPNDILDIFRKESKKIEQQNQQALQAQQEQVEKQLQVQQEEKQKDRDFELFKLEQTLISQDQRAIIQSDWARKQADADLDGQPDVLEKSEKELQLKEKLELKKLEIMKAIEEKKLKLKEEELKIKARQITSKKLK